MALMIRVTMPDRSVWQVPASVVSDNHIAYYADREDVDEEEKEYWRTDHCEITDWGRNNMNWEDVKEFATQVPAPVMPPDYQEGWVNGEWELVDTDD